MQGRTSEDHTFQGVTSSHEANGLTKKLVYINIKIKLPRRISRSVFIRMFKHAFQSGIIATLSSGHIAAIDMAQGKVLDTWDSTGGRIYKIFVPDGQYLAWYQTVNRI